MNCTAALHFAHFVNSSNNPPHLLHDSSGIISPIKFGSNAVRSEEALFLKYCFGNS